ncbi:hypothetical protein [Thalassoroseus pseudoceratinae]|uniref:hypothetical protein n=1 Tax=Thalassoroseus pseudoceratinae TaxID=2713176 RepID=UPI00141E5B30|nr:hypothetical protein [Thalassoroseus pseudoceratinae]
MRHTLLVFAFIVGCGQTDPLVERLDTSPIVASVTVHGGGEKTIVHIADWHHVSVEDLRKELPDDATEEEFAEAYAEFLMTVAEVHIEQQSLMTSIGVKRVWLEGLTDERADGYRGLCEAMRAVRDNPSELAEMMESDLVEMGVAALMIVDGEELEVMPAEDAELWEAGYPFRDGFTNADLECREDEIVRRIVAAGKSPAYLICGGSHDFADNVPSGWCVVRVEVNPWQVATEHIMAAGPSGNSK